MNTLVPQQWLQLKPTTRQALVQIFRIPKSAPSHVVNDGGRHRVESDGHTFEDLKAMSLEEMRRLTNDPSEDFFHQFDIVIKMVEADGSEATVYPQPENATPHEQPIVTPAGEAAAAGTDAGAKEGSQPQAPASQAEVLPVPGGVEQVNPGRDELLPDSNGDDRAGVAAEKTEVSPQQPKVGKDGGPKPRGLQKNQVGTGPV